jgi:hypothetical protein
MSMNMPVVIAATQSALEIYDQVYKPKGKKGIAVQIGKVVLNCA